MTHPDCVFCSIVAGTVPAHVVTEDDEVMAFLDTRPLFVGHTLVIPRRHFETLGDLPAELIDPYFTSVRQLSLAVQAAMGAEGSFVAMNNTVSQSVPHLHTHVVPRNRRDGLRGFFWPRTSYTDESHAAATASRIAAVI